MSAINDEDDWGPLTTFSRVMSIILFSCSVYWLFCVFRLHKHIKQPYLLIRGVTFLYVYFGVSFCLACVWIPLFLYMHTLSSYPMYAESLLLFLQGSFASKAVNILVCRIFLNYIRIRRNQENAIWKKRLNANYTHWVIKYFHILGNTRKVFLFATLYWLVECLCGLYLMYGTVMGSITSYLALISIAISLKGVSMFTLIYKSHGFVDYWFIYDEFKLLLLSVFVAGGIVSVLFLVNLNHETDTLIIFADGVGGVWVVYSWYVQALWVVKKNVVLTRQSTGSETPDSRDRADSSGGALRSRSTSIDGLGGNDMILSMQSEQGFHRFMEHLESEFAPENLLFVSVMLQWGDLLVKKNLISEEESNLLRFAANSQHITLPSNVPTSPIISYDDKVTLEKNFLNAFGLIYRQFFEANRAPWEINIDSANRTRVKKLHEQMVQNQASDDDKHKNNAEFCVKIWNSLKPSCWIVFSMLRVSFMRLAASDEQVRKSLNPAEESTPV